MPLPPSVLDAAEADQRTLELELPFVQRSKEVHNTTPRGHHRLRSRPLRRRPPAPTESHPEGSASSVVEPLPPLTRTQTRLLQANELINQEPPDRADFLHTVMCAVGLPRRGTTARTFERHNGHVSIILEAGKLYDGRGWVDQPLPYGTIPRLVMVHVSSEAIRTQQRRVEIGDSMRQFLTTLGIPTSGGVRGGYTAFRRQMNALAACRLTLGMQFDGKVVTKDAKPFNRFEAWVQPRGTRHESEDDPVQHTLWPGELELTQDFFDTLQHHAVPLDYRALSALKHSALALDIYTWLAHRLCRVNRTQGVKLSWENLKDQFGQEYGTFKDFKKEFRQALHQVLTVYPQARLGDTIGGLVLFPSKPPLAPTTTVSVVRPSLTHK